jgi:ABC-type transporter Mla subunit MlaD
MRRNLTKGQKAMAMAMMYPEPTKGGRGNIGPSKEAKKLGGFSDERVRQARLVLHHSRALAEAVLKNTTRLDDAIAEVKLAQQYQQSDEVKLERLRKTAPDLADQVNEERLKINEAIAALPNNSGDAPDAQRPAGRRATMQN